MSGGAGHVADMNNRMKQNRSLKKSSKTNYKSNKRGLIFLNNRSEELNFKKVSEKELKQIKKTIKFKAELHQKKERLVSVLVILIMTMLFLLFALF